MGKVLKILVIGDFDFANFANNMHHATNLAIEHSASFIGSKVDFYWMRIYEVDELTLNKIREYDGIWLAPGPYPSQYILKNIVRKIFDSRLPFVITGEGFRAFIEEATALYKLTEEDKKVISSNLISNKSLKEIEVQAVSKNLKKLYGDMLRTELTNVRYSIYPSVLIHLKDEVIDVEAVNSYGEPEIVSLKSNPFGVACMNLPQVCSTRDYPHPLINAFLNYLTQNKKALAG